MKAVCVFTGSSRGVRPDYLAAATELGSLLAERRIRLVYGGARVGLMGAVDSMHERKVLMSDLADAFVALPGGWGTLEEFFEVLTWAQLGLHRKPCGLLNVQGYFDRLLAFLNHTIDEGFVRSQNAELIAVAPTCGELLDRLESPRPPPIEKWLDRSSL